MTMCDSARSSIGSRPAETPGRCRSLIDPQQRHADAIEIAVRERPEAAVGVAISGQMPGCSANVPARASANISGLRMNLQRAITRSGLNAAQERPVRRRCSDSRRRRRGTGRDRRDNARAAAQLLRLPRVVAGAQAQARKRAEGQDVEEAEAARRAETRDARRATAGVAWSRNDDEAGQVHRARQP